MQPNYKIMSDLLYSYLMKKAAHNARPLMHLTARTVLLCRTGLRKSPNKHT